jgi:hypothetical protein
MTASLGWIAAYRADYGNTVAIAVVMNDRGSTLVEALVATVVLTTGLLSMAELVRIATATNTVARNGTLAGILAEQKIEQLRALAWEFDASGVPVSDVSTDTTVQPEAPSGGTGLQSSPGSLRQNTPGFVDHVDAGGRIVGRGAQPPMSAAYTRRWSIEPMPTSSGPAVLIQVLVTSVRNRGRADQGAVSRLPGEARLVTLKMRKPR